MKRLYRVINAFFTRRLVITLDRMELVHTDLTWKRLKNCFRAETCSLRGGGGGAVRPEVPRDGDSCGSVKIEPCVLTA